MKPNHSLCLMLVAVMLAMTVPALAADQVPEGWLKRGATNDYEVGVDRVVRKGGKRSAYLKTTTLQPNFDAVVNLMQSFRAEDYRGKRLRFSAQARVLGTAAAAQFWMRIDGETNGSVGFDNMSDRPIRSPNEWKKHAIVLEVPPESLNISFGVMFAGKGQAWVDDFAFEVVGKAVPVTKPPNPQSFAKKSEPAKQMKPVNLDFEK